MMYPALVLLLALTQLTTGLPLSEFYPFGVGSGDGSLPPNDDAFLRVGLSTVLPFYGTGYNTVFVNNNGLLSFNDSVSDFTPRPFPLKENLKLIAPFWADVDTRRAGKVWFRETNDNTTLNKVKEDIAMDVDFSPLSALIVTWDSVGYFSTHFDLTNTFQCVLTTDGVTSFALFLYADDGIQWTTGDNSDGRNGLGGTPALVGVNAGDGMQSSSVSESLTAAIVNIDTTSNVDRPGVWLFQVNEIDEDSSICNPEEIFSGGVTYSWPETSAGSTVTFICPVSPIFSVSRECSAEGRWLQFDQEGCGSLTGSLNDLLLITLTRETLGDFMLTFSNIVAQSAMNAVDQTAENLGLVADLFDKVASFIVGNDILVDDRDILSNTVRTIDSLVQWMPSAIEASSGSRILGSYESILSLHIQQLPDNSSQTFNFTMSLLLSEKLTLDELKANGRNFTIGSNMEILTGEKVEPRTAIRLPPSLFEGVRNRDSIGIFFNFYNTSTLFVVSGYESESNTRRQVEVGSQIIAATVGGENFVFENLADPVETSFIIETDNIVPGSELCVSWDFGMQNWTSEGCVTVVRGDGQVSCSCNHLTNFAILVDICLRQEGCRPSRLDTVLTIVSYVGMIVSIISLVLTLIILLAYKKTRQKEITKYHIQLCLALLLTLIMSFVVVLLSAEDIDSLYGGCVTVSVLVHYFTLVAVLWMGAEALFMFQKLVLVFSHISTKFIIIISIFCWGLPAIIALLPMIIDLTNGNDPENDIVIRRSSAISFCFLSDLGAFLGSFLIPAILVIVFNIIIFIWISIVLICHARRSSSRKIEAAKKAGIVQLMISIGGVMFLFGLTWLFGILTFASELREIFQILFTVFNSFQGFFIFLFFCAISKEARESWKELFGSGRLSELLHSRNGNCNGNAAFNEYDNVVGHQASHTASTFKSNDQDAFQAENTRKNSWGRVMTAYDAEAAFALEMSKRDVFEEDHDFGENYSLKTVTIESADEKESDSESESYKDSYSLASSGMELGADHTNFENREFPNVLFGETESVARSETNGSVKTHGTKLRLEMTHSSSGEEI